MMILLQEIPIYFSSEISVTVITMLFNFSYNISAFVSDIKIRIEELNGELEAIDKEGLGERLRVKKELIKIMKFHAEAKEYSRIF